MAASSVRRGVQGDGGGSRGSGFAALLERRYKGSEGSMRDEAVGHAAGREGGRQSSAWLAHRGFGVGSLGASAFCSAKIRMSRVAAPAKPGLVA
eukprot:3294678-Prymnesium_polylepis.1